MLAVLPSTVPSLQPAVASASRAPSAKNAEVNLLSPFQPYQPWNNPACNLFSRLTPQTRYLETDKTHTHTSELSWSKPGWTG